MGCYYMNGVATCVCDDTSSDVAADLESLWKTSFELSQCTENTRPFDSTMTDQLYITDKLVLSLEDQVSNIPDVDQQLADAESGLQTIWGNFQTEIEAIMNSAADAAESSGDSDLSESLRSILEEL